MPSSSTDRTTGREYKEGLWRWLLVDCNGCFASAAVRSDDSDFPITIVAARVKRRDFCPSLATCGGGHIHVPGIVGFHHSLPLHLLQPTSQAVFLTALRPFFDVRHL
jgi:hypothetical protein